MKRMKEKERQVEVGRNHKLRRWIKAPPESVRPILHWRGSPVDPKKTVGLCHPILLFICGLICG